MASQKLSREFLLSANKGKRFFVRLLVPLILLLCLIGFVRQTQGCEPLPCQSGYIFPDRGQIPENGPAILWVPARGSAWPRAGAFEEPSALLKLNGKMVAMDVEVNVDSHLYHGAGYWIHPKSGWKDGGQYQLEADNRCGTYAPKLLANFKVVSSAPNPEKLGKLIASPLVSGPLEVGTAIGSCSIQENAVWVDVNLMLDNSAMPWEAVFDYQTVVDGKIWLKSDSIGTSPIPGSSWVGHGRDRVYTLCDPNSRGFEGVLPGKHEIVMRGRVLGQKEWLQSEPVNVTLQCPGKLKSFFNKFLK